MKRLFRLAVLLLALTPLVAATCVTEFRQKGPSGPWVGEVTNTGSTPMRETTVFAEIFDATGRSFGNFSVYTCPSVLMPGETGAFEIFWYPDLEATPPLRAQVNPAAISYEWSGDQPNSEGLRVREIERNREDGYVLAEITNGSASTFNELRICATLRDANGTLQEVGNTDLGYGVMLKPGESRQFPIFFNTMPPGGIEFFPLGISMCCPSSYIEIDGENFTPTASRVISRDGQRVLEVVGEIANPYPIDLDGLWLSAHLERSLAERVDQWSTGCNGKLPANGKASVWMWIPLKGERRAIAHVGSARRRVGVPRVLPLPAAGGERADGAVDWRHAHRDGDRAQSHDVVDRGHGRLLQSA
jgi:hypothetical protein